MARTRTESVTDGTMTEVVSEQKNEKTPAESEYTIGELADAAGGIFHTTRECVFAALKSAGVTKCTVSRAKELVETFRKKEVK